MKGQDFLDAMNEIEADLVEESVVQWNKRREKRKIARGSFLMGLAAAAVLLTVLTIPFWKLILSSDQNRESPASLLQNETEHQESSNQREIGSNVFLVFQTGDTQVTAFRTDGSVYRVIEGVQMCEDLEEMIDKNSIFNDIDSWILMKQTEDIQYISYSIRDDYLTLGIYTGKPEISCDREYYRIGQNIFNIGNRQKIAEIPRTAEVIAFGSQGVIFREDGIEKAMSLEGELLWKLDEMGTGEEPVIYENFLCWKNIFGGTFVTDWSYNLILTDGDFCMQNRIYDDLNDYTSDIAIWAYQGEAENPEKALIYRKAGKDSEEEAQIYVCRDHFKIKRILTPKQLNERGMDWQKQLQVGKSPYLWFIQEEENGSQTVIDLWTEQEYFRTEEKIIGLSSLDDILFVCTEDAQNADQIRGYLVSGGKAEFFGNFIHGQFIGK